MSKKVAKKAAKAEPQAKNTAQNKGSRKATPDTVAQDKPSPGSRKSKPAPSESAPEAVEYLGGARNAATKRRVTVTIDADVKQKGETSAAKGSSKKRTSTARKTADTTPRETPSESSSGDEAASEIVGFANSPFAAELDESGDESAPSKTPKNQKAAKKAGTTGGERPAASETAAKHSGAKSPREKGKKKRPVDGADSAAAKADAASEVNEARRSVGGETKSMPEAATNHREARRGKKASPAKGEPVPTPEVDVSKVLAADSQDADASETDSPPVGKRKPSGPTPPPSKRKKRATEAQATDAEASIPGEEAVIDPAAEEALELERQLSSNEEGAPEPDASEDDEEEDDAAILGLGEEAREEEDAEELTEEEENQRYLKGIIEALLFASDKPLTGRELARAARIDKKRTLQLLAELRKEYRHRGVNIVEVSGGFVLRSNPAYGAFVQKALALRPVKLSRAQLETLAIVAYRQPITRPEIDDIRGVDSGQVLKGLADRDLIKMVGKKDEAGRPMLYGTTDAFLELFSLESLKGLPNLREFTELSDDSREKFTAVTGETIPGPTVLSEDGASSDGDSPSDDAGPVVPEEGAEDTGALGIDEDEGLETGGETGRVDSDLQEGHTAGSDVNPDAEDADEPLDSAPSSEVLEEAAPIAELDDVESPTSEGRSESVEVPRDHELDSSPNAAPYFDEGDDGAADLVDDEADELR